MNYELRGPLDKSLTPLQIIFRNRGMNYSKEDILHYVNPTEEDLLDDSNIDNLLEGARLLMKHINNNSKVLLVVDEDCDGYTSSAFLLNYLYKIFPNFVLNNIRYVVHPGKAHGIPIDQIKDEKLIIAPDSSSNEYEIHKQLAEKGIEVLVIDHHEAPEFSKYACVINNQLSDYSNKSLSGAGMVYKFCKFLDKYGGFNYADTLIDVAALGIVGDMMDLRPQETRYITKAGFDRILNPFLQAMVIKQEYSIKGKLNPHRAAFYIVPGINAVTRIGTIEEKLTLFESMLDFKAYTQVPSTKRGAFGDDMESIVEQSCRNCTNIRNRQNRMKDAIVEEVDNIIKTKNLLENKILIIKLSNPANVGITGLVANQIANKYQRPTLILNRRTQTGEITWEGSGRNFSNSPIQSLRTLVEETGLAMYALGHASAFGCGVTDANFNAFVEKTNELLKDTDLSYKYNIDLEYDFGDEINTWSLMDIARCEDLWGQEIEEPVFLFKDVRITKDELFLFKEKVLKIAKDEISFVKMSSNQEEYENLYSEMGYVSIDIIGTCEINDYDQKIQIKIMDYEIRDKAKYLF